MDELADRELACADRSFREIALCLDVLSSMSSRWPLARNCHIVLSDLQKTVRLNRNTLPQSPSRRVTTPGPRNSFQAAGRRVSREAGLQTPDQRRSPKRRRMDPDAQAGHIPGLSGDTQTHPNTNGRDQGERGPQADQPFGLGSGEVTAPGPAMDDPTSSLASAFPPDGRPPEPPVPSQPHMHQQLQAYLPPHDAPIADSPSFAALDGAGPSNGPGFEGDDDGWMAGPAVGNWDGGMPDILGGVTWESLLHVVNQDNLAWRGGFL